MKKLLYSLIAFALLAFANKTADAQPGDYALIFDGVNDQVRLAQNMRALSGNDLTFEMWVKVPTVGTGGLTATERVGILLGNYPDNFRQDLNLEIHTSGRVRVYVNRGYRSYFGTTDLRDAQWHHLAFVRDYTTDRWTAYIDGNLEFSYRVGARRSIGPSILHIGKDNRGGAGVPFHGEMDEIRIWNYAKTQAEVQAGMNTCCEGGEANLLSCWNFNDGPASGTAADLGSLANAGTLTNMDINTSWVSPGAVYCVPPPIPTVSEWGLIFLFLGFLTVGSAWMYKRKEKIATA